MSKATGPLYDVHFRRRREGRTDYAKRISLLKSRKPRLVVRKTLRGVICQVTRFNENGDQCLVTVHSKTLQKLGFKPKRNTPTAYLTGLLAGVKAREKGVKEIVLDVGLHPATKGSIVFACLKGALDAGLQSDYGEEKMPSEDRIAGKHLNAEGCEQAKEKIIAKRSE